MNNLLRIPTINQRLLFLLSMGFIYLAMAHTTFVQAATTNNGTQSNGLIWNIIIIIGFFAIVYFMLILPQKRQNQAHQSMLDNLKIGDEVITNGGIIGKITHVQNQEVKLQINGNTNIEIRIFKKLISDLYSNVLSSKNQEKNQEKIISKNKIKKK